jgi:hypothetical protein
MDSPKDSIEKDKMKKEDRQAIFWRFQSTKRKNKSLGGAKWWWHHQRRS